MLEWLKNRVTKRSDPEGEERAVVPHRKYGLNRSSSWSFSAADGNALLGPNGDQWGRYKAAHTIVLGGGTPDEKASYKLPHHKGEELTTYWRGVVAAAAALVGARGGVQAEAGDKAGAARHLSSHYREFEEAPPEALADLAAGRAAALTWEQFRTQHACVGLPMDWLTRAWWAGASEIREGTGGRELRPGMEIRAVEKEGKHYVYGYAARFNSDSDLLYGRFIERIAPGCFARAIREKQDVRCLWGHNRDTVLPLGRVSAGTLQLREDDMGLYYECECPDSEFGRSLVAAISRGDVRESSFGFMVTHETWDMKEEGPHIRTLRDVDLFDVSPVTFPAYPETTSEVMERAAQGGKPSALDSSLIRATERFELLECEVALEEESA